MKTLLLLILCTLSAQAQLTLRSAAYPPLLKAPAGGAAFDPITSLTSVTNLNYLETSRVVSPPSDGASFSNWPNYGPNAGLYATQSTSGLMPTWISAGRNGLPTVRFDGSDDFMQFGNIGLTGNAPRSYVVVISTRTLSGVKGVLAIAGNSPGSRDGFQCYTSGSNLTQDDYGSAGVGNVGAIGTNFIAICYTHDGSTGRLYTNNVLAGTVSETLSTVDNPGYFFRARDGYYGQGDGVMLGTWRGVFSGADRTNLWNDLAARWSLP